MIVDRPRTSPRRRPPTPRRGRLGTGSPSSIIRALGLTSWWDTKDLTSAGQQTLPNRLGGGTTAQLGSTATTDANDPTVTLGARPFLTTDGAAGYIQLPSTDTPTTTATTGKYTVVVAFLKPSTVAGNGRLFSSEGASSTGFTLHYVANTATVNAFFWGPSSQALTAKAFTLNALAVAALVVDTGVAKLYTNTAGLSAGTSITGTTTGQNTQLTPRLAMQASSAINPFGGNLYVCLTGVGVALTQTQLDAVSAILVSGSY